MDQEETQKAAERIGETTETALQWLLRFAKVDLAKLSEGQWLDLEKEVKFFVVEGPPGLRVRWNVGKKSRRSWRIETSASPSPAFRPTIFWRSYVAKLQKLLREWLDQLMQYHIIEFSRMPLTLRFSHPKQFLPRLSDAELPENGGCYVYFDNYVDTFTYNVAHILGAHSGRLRLCAECKAIFLADRRQQVFCSSRCLNRVTQRRWREKQKKKQQTKKHKSKTRGKGLKGGSAHGTKKR